MKIEIQSHNFPLTSTDEKYIHNRLLFALTTNQVLLEAKQTAAGLLGQASEYLSQDPQAQGVGNTVAGDQASTL
jgi:hypothetical protein